MVAVVRIIVERAIPFLPAVRSTIPRSSFIFVGRHYHAKFKDWATPRSEMNFVGFKEDQAW